MLFWETNTQIVKHSIIRYLTHYDKLNLRNIFQPIIYPLISALLNKRTKSLSWGHSAHPQNPFLTVLSDFVPFWVVQRHQMTREAAIRIRVRFVQDEVD